jgi:hypothetical protein
MEPLFVRENCYIKYKGQFLEVTTINGVQYVGLCIYAENSFLILEVGSEKKEVIIYVHSIESVTLA